MEEVRVNYTGEDRRPKKPVQKPKRKRHGADFGLRIVAVIAAVIVWFILAITQYPTINKTINNVPVNISLENTIAKEKGLSALNFKDMTVDVEIKGMNYEIGNYKASDLVATVDVSKVTKEGQYVLEIDVRSAHTSDSCTIVSVSPSTVTVDFDRITEKQIPVDIEAPYISAADGYTLKDASVTPNEVTLRGPENSLANVGRAVAKIKTTSKLSEDTSIKADEIVLYDKDNNVITDSAITMDENQSFTANFIVYKKKTVKLQVEVTGAPDNFDVSSLPITYSHQEITVITPKLDDSSVETRIVGTLPLSQIRLGLAQTYDIPLSAGEVNLSGESKVTVTVESDEYTTEIFKVSNIITKNRPDGKKVEVETLSLPTVTIIGPVSDLEDLQENDFVASVDMSDINKDGSYSKVATVSISNHKKVWCFGTNEVQIVVSPPSDDSSSSSQPDD